MDKDDPFNRPAGNHGEGHDSEHDFNDDARYDDALSPEVREEEYAAGQEEWDQPIDEFAEEEQPATTHQAQQKHDPFADEGPLEDEFSEHSESDHGSEHDHGEDDHDLDGHDEPAPASQRAGSASVAGMKPPSSIMKYVPYIGGGLAAVAIAFFGYQQFMGGAEPTSTQPSLEHQNTWDSASANPSQQPSQPAANEFQQPAPTAQPTEVAANTQANMITPAQAPVQQQVQAPLPQAEPQQAPAQQQATNALETRISELTQQLDTMKQTQDQLNQKLQQATATPPSMDENSKAATRALEDRIAQLEQKLTAAQSASSSVSPSPSVDAPTTKSSRKSRRAAVDAALEAPASEHASRSKKASTDFMVAKKPKRAKKRSSVQANSSSGTEGFSPTDSRPFQGWILRSAQPGSAWLSQGPYSSDLRRVVPGDKVQGLGTVTAIRQVAGRWVVEGTQGAVR